MIETKTLLNKLSKGGCFCGLCNKPVTIDETENAEYVKSRASGEKMVSHKLHKNIWNTRSENI